MNLSETQKKREVGLALRCLQRLLGIRVLRRIVLPWIVRLEGGEMHSRTLRAVLARERNVRVGMYSYGCFANDLLSSGSIVGRYTSIGPALMVLRRNHPVTRISQHPFFYNASCGFLETDSIESVANNPLVIGNDVWIGARVIVLPKCKTIGDGAIVGAGSVLTRDVPAYSIVAGNPARQIGTRFEPSIIAKLLQIQWWERSPEDLAKEPAFYSQDSKVLSTWLAKVANVSSAANAD